MAIDREAAVEHLARQYFRLQHGRLVGYLEHVANPDVPQAVHQLRVASRKSRSALKFFKPVIAKSARETIKVPLIKLARSSNITRDLEVFIQTAQGWAENGDLLVHSGALLEARSALEVERRKLVELLASESMRRQLTALDDLLNRDEPLGAGRPGQIIRSFAPARLARVWQRALAASQKADFGSLRDLHSLRLDIKQMRYSLDIFSVDFVDVVALTNDLKQVQSELGEINDLASMQARLGSISATDPDSQSNPLFLQLSKKKSTAVQQFPTAWHAFLASDFQGQFDQFLKDLSGPNPPQHL
jgi:CHAD domain-containing protein